MPDLALSNLSGLPVYTPKIAGRAAIGYNARDKMFSLTTPKIANGAKYSSADYAGNTHFLNIFEFLERPACNSLVYSLDFGSVFCKRFC